MSITIEASLVIMRDRPSSEIETNITQIAWRLSVNFPFDMKFHPVTPSLQQFRLITEQLQAKENW